MLEKINIICIIKDHVNTLKNDNSNKADFKDYLLFLMIPIWVPFLLIGVFNLYMSKDFINILITILSIFVGLLLNVMVVIFDIIKKYEKDAKFRLIKESYSNISFAILLSIVTIIPLVICYTENPKNSVLIKVLLIASNGLSYYLLTLFFITLLMIVRRIHIILSDEISPTSNK